jgi:Ni2+-binding GTPase involved in maturation of urease and hydrogenase
MTKNHDVKITISGVSGSGKTQLAHAIGKLLIDAGVSVKMIDDCGLVPINPSWVLKVSKDTTVTVTTEKTSGRH